MTRSFAFTKPEMPYIPPKETPFEEAMRSSPAAQVQASVHMQRKMRAIQMTFAHLNEVDSVPPQVMVDVLAMVRDMAAAIELLLDANFDPLYQSFAEWEIWRRNHAHD